MCGRWTHQLIAPQCSNFFICYQTNCQPRHENTPSLAISNFSIDSSLHFEQRKSAKCAEKLVCKSSCYDNRNSRHRLLTTPARFPLNEWAWHIKVQVQKRAFFWWHSHLKKILSQSVKQTLYCGFFHVSRSVPIPNIILLCMKAQWKHPNSDPLNVLFV